MEISNSCSILISGDFFLESNSKSFNDIEIFGDFLPIIQNSDLAIVNFEAPVNTGSLPIEKVGPNIKTSIESISFLKKAGFNLLTLATNHIMDLGSDGLNATISECESFKMDYIGVGQDSENSRRTALFNIANYKITIINIAENEFGSATIKTPGANPLNPIKNYYDIKKAKKESDFVFIIVHGGHENYSLPSPRMKETYRFFIDVGADSVFCHHSHCISGYEIYSEKPIFYGLGNLVFEWYGPKPNGWYLGYSVQLFINDGKLEFKVIPHQQHEDRLGIRLLNPAELVTFENDLNSLNNIINDDFKLLTNFEEFYKNCQKKYYSYIEPHSMRYLSAFQNRRILPSLWSKRKKYYLLNMIRCESHRDIIQNLLENETGHI